MKVTSFILSIITYCIVVSICSCTNDINNNAFQKINEQLKKQNQLVFDNSNAYLDQIKNQCKDDSIINLCIEVNAIVDSIQENFLILQTALQNLDIANQSNYQAAYQYIKDSKNMTSIFVLLKRYQTQISLLIPENMDTSIPGFDYLWQDGNESKEEWMLKLYNDIPIVAAITVIEKQKIELNNLHLKKLGIIAAQCILD